MSRPSERLVARRALPLALERLVDDPVVLLEGPRSVGKSTLLRSLAQRCGAVLLDLDDPPTRDAVAADPTPFVAGSATVCIDEYQKAPIVLDAIKAERYAGWDGDFGQKVGGLDLAGIADLAEKEAVDPKPRSGRQERIENIVNRIVNSGR